MAKSIFNAAAAVLALSGAASAISFNSSSAALGATAPALGATGSSPSSTMSMNGTSTSSTSSASATATGQKFCPEFNGEFVIGPLDISYEIECDTNHLGVLIDITLQKRATPNSLGDCLDLCSGLTECLAAAYDETNPTCYLFSSVGAAYSKSGFSFAEKASALAAAGSSTSSAVPTAAVTSMPMSANGTTNGTTSANATSPIENLFCPQLDSQMYTDSDGVSYIIECGRNHVGTAIGVALAKRAATTSILNCMAQCDANTACVAVGYNTAAQTCTLFSEVGAAYYDANVDFAIRVAGSGSAVAAGGQSTTLPNGEVVPLTTSTVFTTSLSTILSCAATVTDCPLRGSVVTETIALYTTVCPATEVGAIAATATAANGIAAPIACTSCPYAAVTATVYSTTESTIYSCPATVTNCPLTANAAGSTSPVTVTSMVAVATSVVNYPLPVSTFGTSAPVVAGTGAGSTATAVPVGPSATATKSSGLVSFTGAAVALQAGMGMVGAAVAGAAFLL